LRLIINGENREVPDSLNVAELLKLLNLSSERVAIELNRNVIRRADWSNIKLNENDKLEIIHFVGGG
jgi:thiamine biosynthesis protein ThiS